MMLLIKRSAFVLFVAVASSGPSHAVEADKRPVDSTRIENGDGEAANWLSYGRTYDEQRFSPLKQINADNAKNLGLAWFADRLPRRQRSETLVDVRSIGNHRGIQHLRSER